MGKAVVTLKIMPEGVETDLQKVQSQAEEKIKAFVGETETRAETEDLAFGLKQLKILFVMDEDLGSPEELEKQISELADVKSCETVDVRRTLG